MKEKNIKILIYLIIITGGLIPIFSLVISIIALGVIIYLGEYKIIIDMIRKDHLVILLILSSLISSLLSELWYISILYTLFFIVKLFFSTVISKYLTNDDDIKNVLLIITSLGVIVGLIGLFQPLVLGGKTPDSWVDSSLYSIDFRVYSTFNNPNILASFLSLVIITSIVIKVYCQDKLLIKVGRISLLVSTLCLLYTYSRSGWISLLFAMLVLALIDKRFYRYLFLITILFITFDYFMNTGRLKPTNIKMDSSLIYRYQIWYTTLKIISKNIFFGIGKGLSGYYIPKYSSVIKAYIYHVHNLYLQILLDTGFMGFIIVILFIKDIWINIRKSLFTSTYIGIINTISFGFYITLLCSGMIDVLNWHPQLSIYIWTVVGINRYNIKNQGFNKVSKGLKVKKRVI